MAIRKMYINKHIWENHISFRSNKTTFNNKDTAVYVIEKILKRDIHTTERKGKYGRTILKRKFTVPIGVDTKNKNLFVGKLILGVTGEIVTCFPTRRI